MYHGIRRIPWMKGFISHILPLVYDDSLSYYEFLMKLVNKINEVVEDINKISSDLGKFIGDYITSPEFREYLEEILTEDFIKDIINNESDTINVIDFGANNTGVDCSTEIAVAKAAFDADPNKKVFYFPEGIYKFKSPGKFENRTVKIVCEHSIFTPIRIKDDEEPFYSMIEAKRCYIEVTGVVLANYEALTPPSGSRYNYEWMTLGAFNFMHCKEVILDDCHITNFHVSTRYRPYNDDIPVNERGALWFVAGACDRLVMKNCVCEDCYGEEITNIWNKYYLNEGDFSEGEYRFENNTFKNREYYYHGGSAIGCSGGTIEFCNNVVDGFNYNGSLFNLFGNVVNSHDNVAVNSIFTNFIDTCEGVRFINQIVTVFNDTIKNCECLTAYSIMAIDATFESCYIEAVRPIYSHVPVFEYFLTKNTYYYEPGEEGYDPTRPYKIKKVDVERRKIWGYSKKYIKTYSGNEAKPLPGKINIISNMFGLLDPDNLTYGDGLDNYVTKVIGNLTCQKGYRLRDKYRSYYGYHGLKLAEAQGTVYYTHFVGEPVTNDKPAVVDGGRTFYSENVGMFHEINVQGNNIDSFVTYDRVEYAGPVDPDVLDTRKMWGVPIRISVSAYYNDIVGNKFDCVGLATPGSGYQLDGKKYYRWQFCYLGETPDRNTGSRFMMTMNTFSGRGIRNKDSYIILAQSARTDTNMLLRAYNNIIDYKATTGNRNYLFYVPAEFAPDSFERNTVDPDTEYDQMPGSVLLGEPTDYTEQIPTGISYCTFSLEIPSGYSWASAMTTVGGTSLTIRGITRVNNTIRVHVENTSNNALPGSALHIWPVYRKN